MSTKTLRKRIALVAVSALGAGVLSVAPANATPIADGDLVVIAADNSALAVCAIYDAQTIYTTPSSIGVVISGKASTGPSNGEDAYITVSGPGVITAAGSDWTKVSQTKLDGTAGLTANDSANTDFTVKPTGVGVIKVSISETSTSAPLDLITITVAATCANGTLSSALSTSAIIEEDESDNRLTVTTAVDALDILAGSATSARLTTNVDTADASVVTNGNSGWIGLGLVDTYGSELDADALVATVTSGDAFVRLTDDAVGTAVPAAGLSKTAVLSSTGRNAVVRVSQSVADKPTVAVVQVTYAGTVVATKSITFQGAATSIGIKDVTVGKTSSVGYFSAQVLDAAGNALFAKTVENDGTANADSSISAIASITTSAVSQADGSYATTTAGTLGQFTCAKGGVTTINVKHVIDAATSVKKSFPIACGGVLDTWTISLDKASYAPGEIATLTVTGKDVYGNLVNSTDTLSTIEYSFGGMTAITAPTSTDKFTSAAGVKRYTFSVGTSEGAFVGTFKIAGATDTAAKTVQYKVAAASGAVSMADVLKAIVSLIASINKQIAALQKALLKK